MSKVAVITDSVASLPAALKTKYDLKVLPINISFEGKIYRDGVDLSTADAYKMLQQKPDQFFASPASVGDYLKSFKEIAESAEGILCITLSSKLSGMNNVARLAIQQIREEANPIPIELVDSCNAAAGEGLIVSAAAEAAMSGNNLAEVTRIARDVTDRVRLMGILGTIRYVYRTGRVPKFTARVGSMLKIRPVFTITDGKVKLTGITKDHDSGISQIIDQMRENVQRQPVHVGIAQADILEAGEKLKEKIQNNFNCVELWMTDFSPVMAYATGMGVLVAAYYTDD